MHAVQAYKYDLYLQFCSNVIRDFLNWITMPVLTPVFALPGFSGHCLVVLLYSLFVPFTGVSVCSL